MAMTNFTSSDMYPKKAAVKAAPVETKPSKKFKKYEEPVSEPVAVVEETVAEETATDSE